LFFFDLEALRNLIRQIQVFQARVQFRSWL